MSPISRQVLLGLATCLAIASAAQAQPSSPRIGYVYPAGGRQGARLDVTLGGKYLDGASGAFISGGGVRAFVIGRFRPKNSPTPAIAEIVTLHVTIAANAEPGQRELRLQTAAGLTNPLVFYVGQLPEFQKKERDPYLGAPPADMRVTLPAVVNGQILPGAVDRFRFAARKGERLVFVASSRELIPYIPDAVPGWFQAALAVYDAEDNELAYADHYRFQPDPVLYCEIPKDGEYVLEIRDALYRGRQDFVYRIAAGEFPFVTSIFPLGGKAGAQTLVEMKGWNLPESRVTPVAREPGIHPLSVSKLNETLLAHELDSMIRPEAIANPETTSIGESIASTQLISNRAPFAVDTLPERVEREPNDLPETAQQVTLPTIVNGRIDPPGDWDVFRFEGRAGEQIVAEVLARRLDSPLDSVLRLTDAAGRQLAINDDYEDKGAGLLTHQADSLLRVTLPAGGTYYLHLGDVQHKGGPEYAYRLRISAPRPDFQLRVVPSSINFAGAPIVPLTVYALRKDGFSGEIALDLKDAPAGFSLGGGRVPAGEDQVRITVTAPPRLFAEPLSLRLDGRAAIDGQEISHAAVPAEDMMQAFAYRHLVPAKEFKAAVSARAAFLAAATVEGEASLKIPLGGTARLQVRAPAAALSGEVRVELDQPPEGIVLQSQSAAGRATELVFRCDAAKVKPGLKGNLLANLYAEKVEKPAKGAAQGVRQRTALGMLPAIPFEVVAGP